MDCSTISHTASWHKYEHTFDLTWGNETFDSCDSRIADGAAVTL